MPVSLLTLYFTPFKQLGQPNQFPAQQYQLSYSRKQLNGMLYSYSDLKYGW